MRLRPYRASCFDALCLAALVSVAAPPSPAERYRDFILAAGHAEPDPVRLAHLRKLAFQANADGATLPGLGKLIAFVERQDAPPQSM